MCPPGNFVVTHHGYQDHLLQYMKYLRVHLDTDHVHGCLPFQETLSGVFVQGGLVPLVNIRPKFLQLKVSLFAHASQMNGHTAG